MDTDSGKNHLEKCLFTLLPLLAINIYCGIIPLSLEVFAKAQN